MKKMIFKNDIANIIVGTLLVVLAIVGYFMELFGDFLPIFLGVLLILLSIKRFVYTFQKTTSKNATLILIIEIILDFVFGGLLIYTRTHVELYVGLIVYIRGVSYLIINYIATRKIRLGQYLVNIGYITFGSFLMFTGINITDILVYGLNIIVLLIGVVFLYFGIEHLSKNKKKKPAKKVAVVEPKPITENKVEPKPVEAKPVMVKPAPKVDPKPEPKPEPKPINYESMTVAELKVLAKEKGITGVSQDKKPEIIAKIKAKQ